MNRKRISLMRPVVATHNPDIARLADRVLELHDGQLRAVSSKQ